MSQFRIDEKISESGSTTVYRAFQETLERPVLLKVLHQHLANDPIVRERLTREAKAHAHLRSEHIVHVYDLTEYNGSPAIVMEYVHGRSLKDVIAENPADRLQLAMKTAVSILKALSLAHRRGIVHRDIKPGNILIADDGIVKLTDFGLAHIVHSPTVTIEGSVLGTPAYMAPEQISGERIDARTDFFSLGATLVEALSGERIFEGVSYSECVKKIMEFKTEQLDRLLIDLPADKLRFVKHLMEPDPKKRYQSAADALKDLGEGEEADAQGPALSAASRKVLVPVLFAVAIIAFAGLLYFGTPDTHKVADPGRDPAKQGMPGDSTTNSQEQKSFPVKPLPGRDAQGGKQTRTANNDRPAEAIVPSLDSLKVVFTSNPWAKVYVDGKMVGETPLAQPVFLTRGKHSITFTNPAFEPIVRSIDVRSGREQTVSADVMANAGFLVCAVQPWAEIYVDEQYKDTTPLNRPIVLSAGSHNIRFHNTAFNDTIQVVTIKPGDTLSISITLKTLQ